MGIWASAKHERASGEEAPIGLLLCTAAGAEQLELLQIGQNDVHVAQYCTKHLPPELLERAIKEAQQRGLAQIAARQTPIDEG